MSRRIRRGSSRGESLVGQVVQKTGGDRERTGTRRAVQRRSPTSLASRQGRRSAGAGLREQTAGAKHVLARFKKAYDFAIVQVSVNGQKGRRALDCYSKETTISGDIDLGSFDLKAGRNELSWR